MVIISFWKQNCSIFDQFIAHLFLMFQFKPLNNAVGYNILLLSNLQYNTTC